MRSGAILIVDDEERQREIYHDILEDEGYTAETAPSGEAALQLLAQKRFDLVLTDLNLTGMTGVQLLKEILAADPTIAVVLSPWTGTRCSEWWTKSSSTSPGSSNLSSGNRPPPKP